MDERTRRAEVREFLATRRAKLSPEQAGVPLYGGRRRVPGLRREEVAQLAGVSTDYYTRLEKGNLSGASDGVLDAIARALQLDDVERAHLFDLARGAQTGRTRSPHRHTQPTVRSTVQRVIDSMTVTAAFVRNGRLDVLANNRLGRALYAPALEDATRLPNLARFVYLDPRSRGFYRDWEGIAVDAVGSLRAEAGRDPGDAALTDLVGELSVGSEDFRVRWAQHDVRYYRSGVQPFCHPVVGDLDLAYVAMELPVDPGQTVVAYTAEPGTPSEEKLTLLASWSATVDPASGRAVDSV
ncbi:MAG: helix-turn-helix transcriptional regulator [Actinomycetes bacterium]